MYLFVHKTNRIVKKKKNSQNVFRIDTDTRDKRVFDDLRRSKHKMPRTPLETVDKLTPSTLADLALRASYN